VQARAWSEHQRVTGVDPIAANGSAAGGARVVYVMGPSGAGKDTLLRYARARLDGRAVMFAHRYITRPPRADGGENHVALSAAEFALLRARGGFALDWGAHDTRYGIGIEIRTWLAAGLSVVVSGSRAEWPNAAATLPGALPVLITASPGVLASRLGTRGREDRAAIEGRLARAGAVVVDDPRLLVIDNSGPIEAAGERLVAAIESVAASASAAA
jgi:ribose 1,5-bisphosphokinase